MKTLYRTAALALVISATGIAGAHAEDEEKTSAEMTSEEMQSDVTQSGSDETKTDETSAEAAGASAETSAGEEMAASGSDYCEREWMTIDGNEDGFISGDEATGGLERRFDAIDADGNDAITKTEYIDCKTGTGVKAADAGRDDATFEAADADGDGLLTRKEYGDAAATAYEEAIATDDVLILRRYVFLTPTEADRDGALSGMAEGEIAARSVRNFSFLDGDGNGEISMSEWRVQTPRVGMTDDAATAQFSELDGDGDDEITRKEYEAAIAGTAPAEASGEEQAANAQGVPVFIWWYE